MRLWWGVLALLLLALPARADTLFDISGTATLTGNDTCGGVCVETIDFAFQLDEHPLTCAELNAFECQDPTGVLALLANDLTVTASGPLGSAPTAGQGGFVDDKFMGLTFGGNLTTEFDLTMNPFPPPGTSFVPELGGYLYSCAIAGGCFGFCPFSDSTDGNNCIENLTLQTTVTALGPNGPVNTPEPGTWGLLLYGIALLGLAQFLKRGFWPKYAADSF